MRHPQLSWANNSLLPSEYNNADYMLRLVYLLRAVLCFAS